MLDERDEFLISRYAEGDLSPGERAHVEALLANSEPARELLREYRQLSGLLRLSRETPRVDFDDLRTNVRAAIERFDNAGTEEVETSPAEREGLGEEFEPHVFTSYRFSGTRQQAAAPDRFAWWITGSRRLAVAASLVLALGLAWQVFNTVRVSSPPTGIMSAPGTGGRMEVMGPVVHGTTGVTAPGSIDISIGPAPSIAASHPTIRQDPRELNPGYGRVELLPDAAPAQSDTPPAPPTNPSPF